MQIDVFRDESGFEILREEWNALLRRSEMNTVFLTHEWQSVWWAHLGEGELLIVTVRDDAGDLVGIAPLFCAEHADGQRKVEFVGCKDVSDYLDFIVAAGHTREVLRAVLEVLERNAPAWDVVRLCNVPETSPTCQVLAALATERGYAAEVVVDDVCPVVHLPDSWEAYLEMLGGKDRRELRRKLRRAARTAHMEFQLLCQPEEIEAVLPSFFELHQMSHPEKAAFMNEQMQGFFRAMSRAMSEKGWLELALLRFDNVPVAAMLAFDYEGEILLYNSGYQAEGYYATLSPGWVLIALHIQSAIERGRKVYDFLRGGEEYKYRFGGRDTRVYGLTIEQKG